MCRPELEEKKKGSQVKVSVEVSVSKIVKYVCLTSVCIVAIIFGTRCYLKMRKGQE